MAIITLNDGTDGIPDDDYSSSTADDVILGLGGDDTLAANAANITLDGGSGTDQLFSFVGDAILIGGAGNDDLYSLGTNDVFKYSFNLAGGGGGSGGETFTDFIGQGGDALADNTYTQSYFATQYTAWLKHLVNTNALGHDINGDGIVSVGLNQNDAALDATPFIEGVSADDLAEMFTNRDNVFLKTGKVTHERFYSNSFSTGDGQVAVTSTDGLDTINEFTPGGDKLDFSDITQQQFETLFHVDDSTGDTVITIKGFDGWKVTLVGVSGVDFSTDAVFA